MENQEQPVKQEDQIKQVKEEHQEKKQEPEKKNMKIEKQENGSFLEKRWPLIVLIILIAIIAFSCYIRTINIPGLKDITTGKYTLGPDLDPFWFTRVAKEIVEYGKPLNPDMMRAAPLGVPASYNLHSYLIAGFYKFLTIFNKNFDFMLAAIISPVVFFALAVVFFFLFTRKLFSVLMEEKRANIAALIATAFFVVIPDLLHRTVAGIPEHESSGIMFLFLALYLFICSWQSKGKKTLLLAIGSGIATALMLSVWTGGARYIFMIIGLAVFLAFLFEKVKKKEFLIYLIWFVVSLVFLKLIPSDVSLINLIKSISDVGFTLAILFVLIIDKVLFETKLKEKLKLEKIRMPRSIISLILSIILVLCIGIAIKTDLIGSVFIKVINGLLYPFGTGRIGLTVAENRAPYLIDLIRSFSPIVFWLFFFGSFFLFYEAIQHFRSKKIKIGLIIGFTVFLFLFLFSRYSPSSFLNGENSFSKLFYFAGPIIFIILLLYYYIKANQQDLEDFKNINFNYLVILASLFWAFVSVRGAVRLFFIIAPFLVIPLAFLPVKLSEYAKTKDETIKIMIWCIIIIIAILLLITFIRYEKITTNAARWTIPSSYNQQWQKAMAWVRENTAKDAIFAHWWDYGYWLQSIGERATVVDGGHPVSFWNHLIGRYVLTAPNETDALEFLYVHNVSYFLIDSTDIGKYTAYSSIGSDASGKDRLSWISTFFLDERQTQETRNETRYVYVGGTMLDQDFTFKGQIFPMQRAGIGAFIVTSDKEKIKSIEAIVIYNGQQYRIPVRYFYFNGQLYDIEKDKSGVLQGCLYIVPTLTNRGINNLGAAMYLSEKAMSALWVKLYLLNETENFDLVHSEDALLIEQLKTQYNLSIDDFLVANDFYGPIKIWKINYPKNFKVSEDKIKRYLSRESDLPFPLW